MKRALLCLLLASFAAGLPAATLIVEEIVAKVNGDVVLRSEFDRMIEDLRSEVGRDQRVPDDQKEAVFDERRKDALRDLIDERLLIQKGKELGISVEGQVLRQRDDLMQRYELKTVEEFEQWASDAMGVPVEDLMQRMRDNFLSQSVIGQEVGSRIVVRRDEIQQYYDEHKDEFIREEGVRLSEILISTEEKTGADLEEAEKKAREVHERVQRGELFDEMARRFSDSEASRDAGGDIGIFRRGALTTEIENLVFDKNPGYITDPIDVARGKLILKVVQRYREGLAELEEVEDEIRNRLMAPRYSPAIREYLTELRTRSYIEIRPGYVDTSAAAGMDTSWTDPAELAPVTTTRDEVLSKKKKRRLLWIIPLGGGGDKDKDKAPEAAQSSPADSQ
jgi:parvulin-like peptidyl-prolyl isomerase